jgi:Raf kinase inhibitor-like YbhB/YbcL family protein
VWRGIPPEAKSLAITIQDKDADTSGAGWWHWVIYDIPVTTDKIEKGASNRWWGMPKGSSEARNDDGKKSFSGFCNADAKRHKIVITVYALSVDKLPLAWWTTTAGVVLNLNRYKIKTSNITTYYQRKGVVKKAAKVVKKK